MEIIIAFVIALVLIAVIYLYGIWHQNRSIRKIQKEYMDSLQQDWDADERELVELCYNLEASNQPIIHVHESIQ